MDYTKGRDHDRWNSGTLVESGSKRIEGANLRLGVVVEAIGFIVGDDDGAFRPVLAVCDRIDRVGQESLANLGVRVARVVVIALEGGLDRWAG